VAPVGVLDAQAIVGFRAVPPNIVLIILDAARRDALEPYGAARGSTPAIAQLARRGKALEDVYAAACWTVPSHASMFTGLLPRAAGLARVPSPSAAKPVLAAHGDRLLPEVLSRAGYATGAVSANLWLGASSGFDTGFDDFVSVDADRHGRLQPDVTLRERWRWVRDAVTASLDDGALAAGEVLANWIRRPPQQPFFWFVNVLECHSPYLPPHPYGDVSRLDRARAAEDARRYYTVNAIWRACVGDLEVPEDTLERMRRLYAGAITYLDAWLGRLLERLDAAGVLDDTLVIVTSDHGENFGEGGLTAHAHSLDNRLINVPFVVAGPGSDGREIQSLANLPRFVAEAAGLGAHPWHDGPPEGVGVAQFDAPVDADDERMRKTVDEWGWGEEKIARFTTPLTCAVTGGVKALRRGDREEVYDLAADPLELAPVAPESLDGERAAALERARGALRHPSVVAERAEGQSAAAQGAPSPEELADIEERMKLLGYM
jgi:arylsulfatase A-like enzyme